MSKSTIFGFTKTQLLPIVSTLASEKVDDFYIRFDHRKASSNGIIGEFLVPTITYKTRAGDSLEHTLFVRRPKSTEPGKLQTHHYAFLGENGVPVPRLYGTLKDSKGREVIFLEHLDEVTVSDDEFLGDLSTLQEFLKLMAILNSIKPTVDYAADVGRGMAAREGYTRNWNTWLPWSIHILNRIEEHNESGLLGDQIKRFCQSNQSQIKSLKRLTLELMHVIPNLPVGLIHSDFHPGNTGWRKKSKELVVFDFHDIMFDARFYDAAMVLGDWETKENPPATQRELAEIYLKTYLKNGGDTIAINDFLKEITLVWYARKLNLWEHLPAELYGPYYVSEAKENNRQARLDSLYKNLDTLVRKMNRITSYLE